MTLDQFLDSIAARDGFSFGIGHAGAFVKNLCAGAPRGDLLSIAADDAWTKEIQDAARRIVWSDLGQEIDQKSFQDGSGITAGAILEYDCVLSTRQRDRDGDILEPKGITVDPAMPLLWQHLQLSPIGKHVKVLAQDDDKIVCKFAIADVPLGRDAATLVRFGALRKSHGFKPVPGEFEPIEILKNANGQPVLDDKGRPIVRGWHVKKSNTFEGSLVSIPANAGTRVTTVYEKQFDGLATAYSRDLLKTDVVKHWAKSLYDQRPASAPGVTLDTKAADVTSTPQTVAAAPPDSSPAGEVSTKAGRAISAANEAKLRAALQSLNAILDEAGLNESDEAKMAAGISSGVDVVLSGGGKAFETLATKSIELVTKSMWDDNEDLLPGSYEHLASKLSRSAGSYLFASGKVDSTEGYVRTMATFPTEAIVCWRSYGSNERSLRCFRISYTLDADGKPKFGGDPVEVEIKPQVVEKAFALLMTKGFNHRGDEVQSAPVATAPPDTLTTLARKFAAGVLTADGLGGDASSAISTVEKAIATARQIHDFNSFGLFNN